MLSLQTKEKLRNSHLGPKNGMWKGDQATETSARARARSWFGQVPGLEIHHKDGNPFNNDPDNLVYYSRRYHMKTDGRLDSRDKTGKFISRGNVA